MNMERMKWILLAVFLILDGLLLVGIPIGVLGVIAGICAIVAGVLFVMNR